MAALVAAIHAPSPHDALRDVPAWMPGARPGMTAESELKLTRVRSTGISKARV